MNMLPWFGVSSYCYAPSTCSDYDGGFAFPTPVRRDNGEGTFPRCILERVIPCPRHNPPLRRR
eukprot:920885-Ditylum_brightwellii.AAC.1